MKVKSSAMRKRGRVAFVAGTLGQGGAEKQLVYMVRALLRAGFETRVYCLTRGEHHEGALKELGVEPIWFGQRHHPMQRLIQLIKLLRQQPPDILQSAHFYTNLYVGLACRMLRLTGIGSLRNDTYYEIKNNGRWGPWLLRLPPVLIANSEAARRNAVASGRKETDISVLPNVIDLDQFDRQAEEPASEDFHSLPVVAATGRLVPAKRFDLFLEALAEAKRQGAALRGLIIGDGPERARLEAHAQRLGLEAEAARFAGRRDDVPALLRRSRIFCLSSDHEGFPNVILEAMAARLPVISRPAGDAAEIVRHGTTGYVVAGADPVPMAEWIVKLLREPEEGRALGAAGRRRVEEHYSAEVLAQRMITIYHGIADKYSNHPLRACLAQA